MKKSPTVALIQTSREDLKLRPENIFAFSLASLSPDHSELLCIDDIPSLTPFPSNNFALVDHNRLLSRYSEKNGDTKVVAVLDHHVDEGLYKDTADPRIIIVPTGSATSIVATHIQSNIADGGEDVPQGVATLLLCGILVDTGALKPGGKAEQLDQDAAAFLLPRSTFALSGQIKKQSVTDPAHLYEIPSLQRVSQELFDKKSDVGDLSTRDLLRRDYKEYDLKSNWTPNKRAVRVGLSTVPIGLKSWLPREGAEFWSSADKYMDEHGLDILGILTSFRGKGEKKKDKKKKKKKGNQSDSASSSDSESEKRKKKKEKQGKHKRQVLFIVREISEGGLEERLWAGLEGSEELSLKQHAIRKYAKDKDKASDGGVGTRLARAYKQGNVKATRKAIAPLINKIIEGDSGNDGGEER